MLLNEIYKTVVGYSDRVELNQPQDIYQPTTIKGDMVVCVAKSNRHYFQTPSYFYDNNIGNTGFYNFESDKLSNLLYPCAIDLRFGENQEPHIPYNVAIPQKTITIGGMAFVFTRELVKSNSYNIYNRHYESHDTCYKFRLPTPDGVWEQKVATYEQ